MNDLRDQFRKAGFLSKKDVKRLKHEDRVKHKKEGRGAKEKELEESKERFAQKREEKRSHDRRLEEEKRAAELERERLLRLKTLVENKRISDRQRTRKWFFLTREGSVPYLEMGLDTAADLESGALWIVDLPWKKIETFVILPRQVAKELADFDPGCIRFKARN